MSTNSLGGNMSKKHYLAERANWQMGARITGDKGENEFVTKIAAALPDHYEIVPKPKKIVIYSDDKGIVLDSKIINHKTGKCLFIEKKSGNQGGNATEERAAKFLSKGIKRKIREQFNTPDEPVFAVFSGNTFNGRDGKQTSFQAESGSKIWWVHPKIYREKVHTLFEGENYAIMDAEFANIEDVARQIMEIV